MSAPVPTKIAAETYQTAILKKLNNGKFSHYKSLFTAAYKRPRGSDEYVLREQVTGELLAKLDFVLKRIGCRPFETLADVAEYFRMLLDEKKFILLFAYNGTGKTRLSAEFKALGQRPDADAGGKTADTLYYNAFTEDLFYWDNDLEHDTQRLLKLNTGSRFFAGLQELEMESRIRPLLHRYADFDFTIHYESASIRFSRNAAGRRVDHIKISRGEENIFVWCFFLAVVQLAVDRHESYKWVRYVYVDDPISSLDDNNAVAVASHLAQLLCGADAGVRLIVSSHHSLFFNVLCGEIQQAEQLLLQRDPGSGGYVLRDTAKTPFFHHVALLKELKKAADSGALYPYHFNILRSILEKTAAFHGYPHFSACIRRGPDEDATLHARIINLLSHGDYSLFEPVEMLEDNKRHFRKILEDFLEDFRFNPTLFEDGPAREERI